MSVINQIISCVTVGNNLGFSACQYVPGVLKGLIAVPKGTQITATQALDLRATIIAGLNNTNPNQRWHYLPGFQGVESQNEDAQVYTYPSGKKQVTRGEVVGARVQLDNNFCQYRNAYQWNGGAWKNYDWLEVSDSAIEGAIFMNGNTQVVVGRPFSHYWVNQRGYASPSGDPETFFLDFQYADSTQKVTTVAILPLTDAAGAPFTLATINGVQDVQILNPVLGTSGVVTVNLQTGCGGINFAGIYGTQLTAAGFVAANASTGAAIAITSVAASGLNAATGLYSTYTVTLNTSDPDYVVGQGVILNLSMSGLATLGINTTAGTGNYAGVPMTYTAN